MQAGGVVGVLQVARLGPDDHAQLDLPVGLRGPTRDQHRVVGTHDGGRILQEDHRFDRCLCTCLSCVVAVVQPDAHHLPGPGDRRPHSQVLAVLHDRKPAPLDRVTHDRGGHPGEEGAVDIVGQRTQVEEALVRARNGDLVAGFTEPAVAHAVLLPGGSTTSSSLHAGPGAAHQGIDLGEARHRRVAGGGHGQGAVCRAVLDRDLRDLGRSSSA